MAMSDPNVCVNFWLQQGILNFIICQVQLTHYLLSSTVFRCWLPWNLGLTGRRGDREFTSIPILCTNVMLYRLGLKIYWSIFTLVLTDSSPAFSRALCLGRTFKSSPVCRCKDLVGHTESVHFSPFGSFISHAEIHALARLHLRRHPGFSKTLILWSL